MGIRKSQSKNKKSTRPPAAIAVRRDEAVRKARRPLRRRDQRDSEGAARSG
jgi:hypothetical protein